MWSMARLLAAVVILSAGVVSAQPAPRRVALIVANTTYAGYAPLPNTATDAVLVKEALEKAGFQSITLKDNLGIAQFRTELGLFKARADGAEVAMVYFAGHGVEVGGRNWLIPVDAALGADTDLEFQAVDANLLFAAAGGARTRIVVLDACRANPFAARMRRLGRVTRDIAPGLAPVSGESARGSLLMYSAAAGEFAADGPPGRGSPFARAFRRFIPEPGAELRISLGKIADAVFDETRQQQLPYTSMSLSGVPIVFVPPEPLPAPAVLPPVVVAPPPPPPTVAPNAPTAAGAVFRDCTGCTDIPEMVVIPAGSFIMGSPRGERGRDAENESPQMRVAIARPFALSKTEVTVAEYFACVTAKACLDVPRPGDTLPVTGVSRGDALSYIAWLNARVGGQNYRLPSEAEWEYAARGKVNGAANDTPYPWGASANRDNANFSGTGGRDTWNFDLAPVGKFLPNPFGLFDMHGNASEYVQNCWAQTLAAMPADGSAPASRECSYYVTRGGDYFKKPEDIRSARREISVNGSRDGNTTFRLARTIANSAPPAAAPGQ